MTDFFIGNKDYDPNMNSIRMNDIPTDLGSLSEKCKPKKEKKYDGFVGNESKCEKDAIKEKVCEDIYYTVAENAFLETLYTMYRGSLVLDEDFIQAHEEAIRNYLIETVKEEYGDIYNLMEACKKNSKLLNKVVESCKKKGKKASNEAYARMEAKETTGETIDKIFDDACQTNSENTEELKKDMDVEEVCNVVKEKVVKTISDEEKRNEEKKELVEELNKAKSIGESVSLYKNPGLEHETLFHSIMVNRHKQCIRQIKQYPERAGEYGTINESGEISIDMDYVLCDTILEYTRLELLNTIKITNYIPSQVRQLAEDIMYKNV